MPELLEFVPSDYQKAIFDWIRNGEGNAIVNAVAGSGKTTTLVKATDEIESNNVIFIAFNKFIVEELKKKLRQGAISKTIHSVGYNALMRHTGKYEQIDPLKYKKLCLQAGLNLNKQLQNEYEIKEQEYLYAKTPEKIDTLKKPPTTLEISSQLEKMIDLSRATLTPLTEQEKVQAMIIHFGIEQFIELKDAIKIAKELLEYGEQIAIDQKRIDFGDMIWLPYKWNLKFHKYDWVLVDEAQDLNALQLEIILRITHENSRLLFVGDPKQAIYGFTGADSESFEHIKVITEAKEFPLSISYRCPKSVIELAQKLVPKIKPKPDAIEGEIIQFREDEILQYINQGDTIICRATEPLVRTCIKLIANQIPATVKGKEIGKSLTSIVEDVAKAKNFTFNDFILYLHAYKNERIEKLKAKVDATQQIENFTDQIKCIEVIHQNFADLHSISDLNKAINRLFDDEKSFVTLSTIHRVKGLEGDRIFILYYEKLPVVWEKQREWQLEQEKNLKYVALTRTKKTLFLVKEVPDLKTMIYKIS